MEVDDGNHTHRGLHANIEAVKDDEFFEFEVVESIVNKNTEDPN